MTRMFGFLSAMLICSFLLNSLVPLKQFVSGYAKPSPPLILIGLQPGVGSQQKLRNRFTVSQCVTAKRLLRLALFIRHKKRCLYVVGASTTEPKPGKNENSNYFCFSTAG